MISPCLFSRVTLLFFLFLYLWTCIRPSLSLLLLRLFVYSPLYRLAILINPLFSSDHVAIKYEDLSTLILLATFFDLRLKAHVLECVLYGYGFPSSLIQLSCIVKIIVYLATRSLVMSMETIFE